jgi:hypothetical protein
MAVTGGAALIVGTLTPLIVTDSVDIALLASYEHASMRRIYDPSEGTPGIDATTVSAIIGLVFVLIGVAAVLLSTWLATARRLFPVMLVTLAGTIAMFVLSFWWMFVPYEKFLRSENIGFGWLPLAGGQILILAASLIDRRLHRLFMRGEQLS